MKKRFWAFFLGLSSATNLKRQTVSVQKVVWQLLKNLQDHFYLATPSRFVKTKTFEKKKAVFPAKKSFWPVFPRIIECEKPSGRFLRVHNVFWHLLWKLSDLFCNTYEVVEKNSWKKSKLSGEKNIVAFFFSWHRTRQMSKKPYKGPESLLTSFVQVMSLFLFALRGCFKHNFLKKWQTFQWRKKFGLLFLVLSSLTNVKEHSMKAHNIFWQLLWE